MVAKVVRCAPSACSVDEVMVLLIELVVMLAATVLTASERRADDGQRLIIFWQATAPSAVAGK